VARIISVSGESAMAQNLLLMQDDAEGAKAVQNALSGSRRPAYHVEWVRSCAAGVERLTVAGKQRNQDPDGIAAVLVELDMPDTQGMATFDRLFAAAPQIPILILSSARDEETAKLAVQRGAQDYFFKDRLDGFLLPKALAAMVDRAANTEALFEEKERAQVTLNSIGDAVISTDVAGRVSYLNLVAERLTGWARDEAIGRPLEEVFRIIDAATREAVPNPMAIATKDNVTVGLTPNCVLIRRDGIEAAIEDSAAPIHDRRGRVTGAVMVFHDVSTARALSQKMAYLAQHDSLTDLPNRVLLNDRLTQAMAVAQRRKEKIAVLYLDVDRFKHINDSLGHPIGDRLLQSVARRLTDCARASDTVSRQGGDEFVVLFSEVLESQDAATCAEKILQAVGEPHHIDQHDIHVTTSIGIVLYPDDGTDAETLLKNADSAMYQAKDSGRNNYQFFKVDLNTRATERQTLETDLRHAITRGEFELYYQPKMRLASGAITGFEALIRWRHPERGLIHPGQFIPIAEESGLIVSIGHWVLREGCRQASAWRAAGFPPFRLAVNISAVELRAKDFVPGVRAVLAETGFDPQSLELELTETFLMQDSKSTVDVLRSIKDMGLLLALDDFGTGYSSLSYMRRFPIDTLKVDRSFVRDLTTDDADASIVSAVINMGKGLHMNVIAEGVETREQLAFLEEHACPEAQGYYFSHPVAAAEFTELLRHGISRTGTG
jgi:diguanylate cyclase (GGDEF)-like protein/PAS domain S-box-containing protein